MGGVWVMFGEMGSFMRWVEREREFLRGFGVRKCWEVGVGFCDG